MSNKVNNNDFFTKFITIGFWSVIGFLILNGLGLFDGPDPEYETDSFYDSDSSYSSSVDHDCGDFTSAYEAQLFFEANGSSDPHDLDRDGDGYACEWNP